MFIWCKILLRRKLYNIKKLQYRCSLNSVLNCKVIFSLFFMLFVKNTVIRTVDQTSPLYRHQPKRLHFESIEDVCLASSWFDPSLLRMGAGSSGSVARKDRGFCKSAPHLGKVDCIALHLAQRKNVLIESLRLIIRGTSINSKGPRIMKISPKGLKSGAWSFQLEMSMFSLSRKNSVSGGCR